jgi:hypothetical protein
VPVTHVFSAPPFRLPHTLVHALRSPHTRFRNYYLAFICRKRLSPWGSDECVTICVVSIDRSVLAAFMPEQWVLSITYCFREDQDAVRSAGQSGQGMLVFSQPHVGVGPEGALLKFDSTKGAPVHLRSDMLYFRPSNEKKVSHGH